MRVHHAIQFARLAVRLWIAAVALVLASSTVSAGAVGVSYTISGVSGAWTLDFTFSNNVPGQSLYFFGVVLPAQDVVSSPAGYVNCWNSGCAQTTIDPDTSLVPVGTTGPNVTFNDLWRIDPFSVSGITFGESLSGFDAGVNSALPPTSVEWFAFTADLTGNSPYTGGQNFVYTGDCLDVFGVSCALQSEENPLFEGFAAPAPEPSSFYLLLAGIVGVGVLWLQNGNFHRRRDGARAVSDAI